MYFNDVEYELPKKTMALNDKIEAVNNAKTTKIAYTAMMDFVVYGLGKDKIKEILGTTDVNKVDLIKLNMLSNDIVMAYDDMVQQPQIDKINNILSNLPLDNLANVANNMKK